MIIDTHAHLTSKEFSRDLDQCVSAAKDSGVTRIVAVSEDLEDAKAALRLSRDSDLVRPGAGLFPTILDRGQAEEMYRFIREKRDELACIGEVGLDFWKVQDHEGREVQKEIFSGFVELSNETGLPLNCHSRSAGRHIIELLLSLGAKKVQLHAFDARPGTALKGEEAGFFFSIPPSIARSRQKQRLVRALRLESLLLESDAPVLGPEPGVRNEPKNTRIALEAISEIKALPVEQVEETIFENSRRLYGEHI